MELKTDAVAQFPARYTSDCPPEWNHNRWSITGRTVSNRSQTLWHRQHSRRKFGLTCISKQTGMERDVLISHSDKRGRMGRERTDLLRGTLDLLILKALVLNHC